MKDYKVVWEIDIEASSPREAARKALKIQRSRASIATVFKVKERIGYEETIDLSEIRFVWIHDKTTGNRYIPNPVCGLKAWICRNHDGSKRPDWAWCVQEVGTAGRVIASGTQKKLSEAKAIASQTLQTEAKKSPIEGQTIDLSSKLRRRKTAVCTCEQGPGGSGSLGYMLEAELSRRARCAKHGSRR